MSDLSAPASLAWQVNELLIEDRSRVRFRELCIAYLRLRADEPTRPPPLPFDVDGEYNFEPLDKPPLMLCERYAILVALHDVYCHQEAKVNPAPWPEELPLSWVGPVQHEPGAWDALLANAKLLDESHLPNLQACLATVRNDLEDTKVREPPRWSKRLQIKKKTVYLDGEPIPLDLADEGTAQALDFLRELIEDPGNWKSSPEIGKATNNEGVRFDRVLKSLPDEIKSLIETDRRKGNRLRPPDAKSP